MPMRRAHGRHVVRPDPSDHPSYVLRPVGVGVFRFYPYRMRRRKKTKTGWTASPPRTFPWGFRQLAERGRFFGTVGHHMGLASTERTRTPLQPFSTRNPASVRIAVKDGWKGVSRAFCRIVGPAGRPCMVRPRTMVGYGRGIKKQSACGHLFILATSKAPRS